MTEHVSITDPELHEPKGAAAASADQVIVADGAGSTAWGWFSPDYGGLCTEESDAATLGSIGTTKQTFPFVATCPSNGVTVSAASNNITVAKTGTYWVGFSTSFSTVAAGDAGLYHFTIMQNAVETNIELFRQMSGSSDTGSAAMQGLLSLTAADVLTVQIESDEAGDSDDINIDNASLIVYLIQQTA